MPCAVGAAGAGPPATITPGELTVGVSLPSDGFEVGVVRGSDVLYAEGFDIDLARAIAKRLRLHTVTFVQSRFDRLFSAGAKPWDIAVAQITITGNAARSPRTRTRRYLSADQGVLPSRTVTPVPKTVAGLRPLRLTDALREVDRRRRGAGPDHAGEAGRPRRPGHRQTLMLSLPDQGDAQAVVYDAPSVGTLKAQTPERYGPFIGVIKTGEQYGIALPKGSTLLQPVDAALGRLIADGTVGRLQRKWLTADLSKLPVLG